MNLALFVHILGAMVLVGSLALVALALADRNLRLGFRALLAGVLPGWIVMRGGAEWISEKQGINDLASSKVPAWVDIGYAVAEPALLLILAAAVCTGLAASRDRSDRLRVTALVLVGILLVACVIAIWAMTTKPT